MKKMKYLNSYKNFEIVLNTSETWSLIILAKALLSVDTYDWWSLLSYLASLESWAETWTWEEIPDPPPDLPIIDLWENETINCGWCN